MQVRVGRQPIQVRVGESTQVAQAAAAAAAASAAAAATQAANVSAEAVALAASARDATRGGDVAGAAIAAHSIIYRPTPTGQVSASTLRWAKGYDAHATDDNDTSIRIGRTVSAVVLSVRPPATATHVRVMIYRRATSQNGVPGGAYDTLVADSGALPVAGEGIAYNSGLSGYGLYVVRLPVDQHLRIVSGFCYVFVAEFQNSAAAFARVACNVPYKQITTVAQRLTGYYDTAGTWINQTVTRPVSIGYCEATFTSLNSVKDTAEDAGEAVLSATQESRLSGAVRLMLKERPWSNWKYPGVATTAFAGREGLANILGQASWAAGFMRGQLGVDFGALSSTADMVDLKTDPNWLLANLRLLLSDAKNFNAPGGFAFTRAKLEGGYIDFALNRGTTLVLEDVYLDAAGLNINYGITQPPALTQPGKLSVRNATITGFKLAGINLTHAEIYDSYLDLSAADNIVGGWSFGATPDFSRPIYIEGCLMRRPANSAHPFADALAHGDVTQIVNAHGLTIVGSTLYMPASLSGYDEGVIGSTSAIAQNSMTKVDGQHFVGNILVGGAYTVYLGMAASGASYFKNTFYVNNIFGGGGTATGDPSGAFENYAAFGEFNFDDAASGATYANIGLFGNVCADGYPIRMLGDALPALANVPAHTSGLQPITLSGGGAGAWLNVEGIFNYSWDQLRDEDRELLFLLGRERGEWIIDFQGKLNPKYNLGSLKVAP